VEEGVEQCQGGRRRWWRGFHSHSATLPKCLEASHFDLYSLYSVKERERERKEAR
jgi:hypothetical protein